MRLRGAGAGRVLAYDESLKSVNFSFFNRSCGRLVDIRKAKPKRAPTTDTPPPEDHGYVQGPIDKLLHHDNVTLLNANKDVTGSRSLNYDLKKRPI